LSYIIICEFSQFYFIELFLDDPDMDLPNNL
jgi:hypothetical protein